MLSNLRGEGVMRYQVHSSTAGTVRDEQHEQHEGKFRAGLVRACAVALTSPLCTSADRQLISDVKTRCSRYAFRAVDRIIDLLATAPEETAAVQWPADLRGCILARRRRHEVRAVRQALVSETRAQNDADLAQLAVVVEYETPDLLLNAIHATSRERDAVDALLDSLTIRRAQLMHGSAI